MLVKKTAIAHPCETPIQAWDKLKEELMEYVHEDTPQQERVCARRNRTVMNKETRQDVFEGKLPTKAVKEEKTPFDEQIFGIKDWDSQVCKSDLVENEAKVENELLEKSQLETEHLRTAKFKKLDE